jgi:ribose/xylose/arabinose/galactoside ABC-type transport system permease subunit
MNLISTVRSWGTYVVLVILIVIVSITTPNFLTVTTITANLQTLISVVVIASAVTLLMVGGSLDLSVGGVMALSGVVSALLAVSGVPVILALLSGVAIGAVCGLVNGIVVVQLGVNPVIATIGTGLYLALGAANLIAKERGGTVSGTPAEFKVLGTGYFGPLPIAVLVMFLFVAIMVALEKFTLVGKYSVAMGSNYEGARLAGIPVGRLKILLFTLSGLAAGLAGVLVTSRLGSGVPNIGQGVEFDVIVAAVLGGVSLAGGRGTVLATCAGAAMLVVIQSALNMKGVDVFWQLIITGVLLIGMVTLDVALRGGSERPQWMSRVRRPEPKPSAV